MLDQSSTDRAAMREQLELQIAVIERNGTGSELSKPMVARAASEEGTTTISCARAGQPVDALAQEPFGRWLLAQRDREDWIDHLASAARSDVGFPKNGSVDDVRRRLVMLGADGDAHEQLDDAERHWREC